MGLLILAGVVFLIRQSKPRNPVLNGPDRAAHQSAHMHLFKGSKAELDSSVRAELGESAGIELDSRVQAELDARARPELDTDISSRANPKGEHA